MKKALSLFLSLIMLFGTVAIGGSVLTIEASAEDAATTYNVGDIIEFGSYPQSRIPNAGDLYDKLNAEFLRLRKTSYNYYSGTGNVSGNKGPSDFMIYVDFIYNDEKYRGVKFTSYRPSTVYGALTNETNSANPGQAYNGYYVDTIYFFKYEPLTWRVLDPKTGLVMCNTIIDSQPYNNYIEMYGGKYWGDKDHTYSPNNYEHSSIREWLSNDFYNTAFSSEEKGKILVTENKNTAVSVVDDYSALSTNPTYDNVFLLSYDNLKNSAYGFDADVSALDAKRKLAPTDYSKCQGVEFDVYSPWLLRNPTAGSAFVSVCDEAGRLYVSGGNCNNRGTYSTRCGIVPAMRLATVKSESLVGETIEYGTYPQSEVKSSETLSKLNTALEAVLRAGREWVSYGYYSGTGNIADGKMTASDYMRYIDIWQDGVRYRAVAFEKYRPTTTGGSNENVDSTVTSQRDNGYTPGHIYWFKFEPIRWKVLNDKGFIITESIIDSQPLNNYLLRETTDGVVNDWNSPDKEYYVSNLSKSQDYIKLETDICNLALNDGQKNNMASNFAAPSSSFISNNYGFGQEDVSDTARMKKGTDYAKCQGLSVRDGGYSRWWTSKENGNSKVIFVSETGSIMHDNSLYSDSPVYTNNGIVCVTNLKTIVSDGSDKAETHNYKLISVPATCTEESKNIYICENCGNSFYSMYPDEPKGHTYVYTSNNNGNHTVKCANCDYNATEACTMSDPTQVTAPTCTDAGVNERKCSLCGYTVQSDGAPATDHSWGDHTYDGETAKTHTRVCANDSSHTETVACTFDNGVVTKEASCSEKGVMTYTCSVCKGTYTEDIDKSSHTPAKAVEEDRVEPDCVVDGSYNSVVYCSECGEKLSTEAKTIPAKGHTAGEPEKVYYREATCVDDGTYVNVTKCTECGEELNRSDLCSESRLGHSFTSYVSDGNATCTKDGTKTAKCDRCDVTDTVADKGSAKGHVDKNKDGKCDVCGIITDANLVNPTRNAKINVAAAKTVDYRTKVTIKATAENVPEGYILVMTVNGMDYRGNNKEVTCETFEIKGDTGYTVKVIDNNGNVQKDANGKDLVKDGGKITCKAGFIQKLIAFFKALFKVLPAVTIKP